MSGDPPPFVPDDGFSLFQWHAWYSLHQAPLQRPTAVSLIISQGVDGPSGTWASSCAKWACPVSLHPGLLLFRKTLVGAGTVTYCVRSCPPLHVEQGLYSHQPTKRKAASGSTMIPTGQFSVFGGEPGSSGLQTQGEWQGG